MRKRYDPKLHMKARPAELAVKAFLDRNRDVFGKYLVHCGDFIYDKDGYTEIFLWEVEWREKHWREFEENFPYKTVSIPRRKLPNMRPYLLYFQVRVDFKRALMLTGEDIIEHGIPIIKNNIYAKNEPFIEVSAIYGKHFDL